MIMRKANLLMKLSETKMTMMQAIAAVTAGSGWTGPGAFAIAAAIGSLLLGYAASLGVEGVGGSVGASAGAGASAAAAPTMGSAAAIKPINVAAANNQTAQTNNQPQGQPVINVMLETKVDPLNRKKVEMVVAKGTSMDSSTGQNANVKVNAIGKV